MKFAMKSLAVAAALVAVGSVSAQTVITGNVGQPVRVVDPNGSGRTAQITLLSGGGDLKFSVGDYDGSDPATLGGAVGALNAVSVQTSGSGGLTFVEGFDGDGARNASTASSVISSVSAISDGPNAGAVQSVNAGGTATQITPTGPAARGGTVNLSNLRFDLAQGRVYANAAGTLNALGTNPATQTGTRAQQFYTANNMVMWTFDPVADVTGPTRLNPSSLLSADPVSALLADGYTSAVQTGVNAQGFNVYQVVAKNLLKNLQMTNNSNLGAASGFSTNLVGTTTTVQGGEGLFRAAFGVGAAALPSLLAVNGSPGGWGTVQSTLQFEVQEVPEPSTYALMGLGLVGIGLMARRRRAA